MATTYENGSVPGSLLAPLDGQPGAFLRADAAAAWNRARADVLRRTGIVLRVRGWNRTLAEQITFYLQRHTPWKPSHRKCCYWPGHGWYTFTGTAHAAPPGTSNHGWGLAIDVEDYGTVGQFNHPRRVATFPILAEHGWTDTEGRGAIREPWHLVYNPAHDAHTISRPGGGTGLPDISTPGGQLPAPITPRGPLMALTDDEQKRLLEDVASIKAVLISGSSIDGVKYSGLVQIGAAILKAITEIPVKVWTGVNVWRGGKPVSVLQDLADTGTLTRDNQKES